METSLLGNKKKDRSDDENLDYDDLSKSIKVKKVAQDDKVTSVMNDNQQQEQDTSRKTKDQKEEIIKEAKQTNEVIKTTIDNSKEKVKSDSLFSVGVGILSSKPTESLFSWNLFSNKENMSFTAYSNANNDGFFTKNGTKDAPSKKDEENEDDKEDEENGDDDGNSNNNNNDKDLNNNNDDDMFYSNPQSLKELKKKNNSNTISPLITQESSSLYEKLISKSIDNLYLFHKEENKFKSKGKGFLSLETSKQEKKSAVIVFRNQMGAKIVEGYLNKNLSKFESYIKNYNNVASIIFIQFNKDNQLELKNIKIPFKFESDFREVENAFHKAMTYLISDDNKTK